MCSRHHTKHTNNKAKKSHPEKKQHQGSHSTIYQPTNQPQRQHSSLPSFPRYAPASLLITPNPPIYIHTATLISRASLPSRAHNRQATLTKDTKNERKKKGKICLFDRQQCSQVQVKRTIYPARGAYSRQPYPRCKTIGTKEIRIVITERER
jgi:hypothetical protein